MWRRRASSFRGRRRSLKLAQLATLPFVERIDPAIKHQLATAADQARPREARVIHNQHPQRKWCEGREVVICLRSTYKLEGRLPIGIQLANKIREGSRRISDTLEFDSELTVLSAAEVGELGLAKLTGLDTPPAGALEQSIFYVNQVMQFGKLLAVFQAHPSDPGQDRGQRLHGAGDRVEPARQAEAVRQRAGAAQSGAGAGACWARARSTAASRSAPGCRSMPATRSARSRRSSRPAVRPPASRRVNPVR